VKKIWNFEYKIITSQLACDAVPYTHDRKTVIINVKKLTSLKLGVRTTWGTQSTKTAKIFWVTLDGAMQGGVFTS